MATYAEISENKTCTLSSSGGTTILTYYAGNKNKTTGSVVGNIDLKEITYVFDGTSSWITSVTLTKIDDTAKNIKITYQSNTSTSERQVNLKLKDQTSAYYLVLKQPKYSAPDNTQYEYKFIINSFPSKPSKNIAYLYKVYCEENTNLFVWIAFIWAVTDYREWYANTCAVQFDECDYMLETTVPLSDIFEGYVFTNRNHPNYTTLLYTSGNKTTPKTTTYSCLLTDTEAKCFIYEDVSYYIDMDDQETLKPWGGNLSLSVDTTNKTITVTV